MIDMLDGDADPEDLPQYTTVFTKMKISDLFDFQAGEHWVASAQRSAIGSVEEEMAFYDVLDFDAAGEPDMDYDVDDCVESIYYN